MKGLVLQIILFSVILFAQNDSKSVKFGSETDLVPFITGGYYGSFWVSYENFRLRTILADVNMPAFMTPNGFDEHEVKANAVTLDYFFKKDLTGFWIAGGIEFWKNRVRNELNFVSEKFNSTILTFGAGYVIDVWENIYINPWGAIHYSLSKNEKIIGGELFKEKELLPEFSLKIGYRF